MEEDRTGRRISFFPDLWNSMRKYLFSLLSVGPIPEHIAFIMDGNRRYAKKKNLKEGAGHRAGFLAMMTLLKHCYEFGVKYTSIYAFSIDNFRRRPEEVQQVMDLMQEKIEGLLKEESLVNKYGVRVYFIGNLELLHEPVRNAAEKVMMATAHNTKSVLLICAAYTSSDEIVHAVQESCIDEWDLLQASNGMKKGKRDEIQYVVRSGEKEEKHSAIKLVDLEKHMYMALAPDPDILIRSGGGNRLSNFFLWQTRNTLLYSPSALWPELGLRHLVWAILNFQRNYSYFEKKKKQL